MAITSTTNKVTYTGNDVASVFPYTFKVFANTELTVDKITISTEAVETLTLTTDYTVSDVGVASGGNVTLVAGALSTLYKLVIKRVLPLTQGVDFIENDSAPAETFEEAYDRDIMIAQQLQETIDRCLKMKVYSSGVTTTLPDPTAGYYLAWNAAGTAIENVVSISLGDADLDTDGTLAANSDTRVASQKATKTYVDTSIEVNTETAKTAPVSADIALIEDSAATWARKKVTLANITKGLSPNALTTKATPVNADEIIIGDTEASNVAKKTTIDKLGLWEVDGTETQLKTADELDMQTKRITAMGDPTAAQDAATRAYVDGGIEVFTSSGTWTRPAGVVQVTVEVVGGGGNGGNGIANYSGGGGGAGGYALDIADVSGDATVAVTVGAAGGTSSFGAFCVATGGSNGEQGANEGSEGGAGGVGTSGDLLVGGGDGGGSGGQQTTAGGVGGSSHYGGGGAGGPDNTHGSAGNNYGAGGGGGGPDTNMNGGAGAGGLVIVRW